MLVTGAKGHAKEVLQILQELSMSDNLYFFDDVSENVPESLFGKYPVIRNIEMARRVLSQDKRFVLGTGNPRVRHMLAKKMREIGGELTSITAPSAIVGTENVQWGKGLNIMHRVLITNGISIGEGTLINAGATIHHDVVIGEYCEIGPGVHVLGQSQIGRFCQIGAGAIILPGLSIADHVTVGAGAVVTKHITSVQTVIGIPARKITK